MSASKWKPYPSYKDSETLAKKIPIHWNELALKRVSTINDDTLPEETDPMRKMCYVDIGSVSYEDGITRCEEMVFEKSPSRARRLVNDGDVIVSTVRTYLKAICKIKNPMSEMVFSTGFAIVRPDNSWNKDSIGDFIVADYFVENVVANSDGVSYPAINASDLGCLKIIQPPKIEQEQVKEFLESKVLGINNCISRLEKIIYSLEYKRSTLITQAVTKGLNSDVSMKDSGLDWYPEIPSHWKLRRVKHIATISPSNVDKKKYDGQEEVRLANYVDVYYNDRITDELDLMVATASESEIVKFSLKAGDLIITKDSETWDDIAVPAFVPETMEGVVCGYHLSLIRPNQKHVLGEFLFRTYQALGIRDQYHYYANGVTRYGLGSYWVNNGVVPVPPLDEQLEIAQYIDKQLAMMETIKEQSETQIAKLKQFRTALISAVVTGKIDVRSL